MLQIKQKLRLSLPRLSFYSPKPLQFSPVVDDDDELTQAILNDAAERDDDWELTEHPDAENLEAFWSEVQRDTMNDPDWYSFS